ncbi:hypothetical protein [Geobacillus phage GR1]|nr:hypothetical protein [Geobacillus phage GR1]
MLVTSQVGISKVLEEMVREAAREINFPFDQGCVEQVRTQIWANYDIELNDDAPINWRIMQIIVDEIQEWQQETAVNHM